MGVSIVFLLMSGATKIEQSLCFRDIISFLPSEKKTSVFCDKSSGSCPFFRRPGTNHRLYNSHSHTNLKKKAYLLPSWCLHYYLHAPPHSDRTRSLSQGASSQRPPLGWFTTHNDGYTEDYFTHSRTIASVLAHLVSSTHCDSQWLYIMSIRLSFYGCLGWSFLSSCS